MRSVCLRIIGAGALFVAIAVGLPLAIAMLGEWLG
jgi:hypothetical protein